MIPEIIYEYDTELAEYEAEQKSYRSDVIVKICDKKYKVHVIAMVRLQQDFEREMEYYGYYSSVPNTIIVKNVTKKEIEDAILQLYREKYFEALDNMGFFYPGFLT